jgi:hypothetical protein
MDSTNKAVLASVLAAVLGAAATLGAAYISKVDFNPSHREEVCDQVFDSLAYEGVRATLVSINSNDTVSYAQGPLSYDGTIPRLAGTTSQFFNDRANGNQPFNVKQTDSLGIAVIKEKDSVKLAMTLKSWGNVIGTVRPTCTGSFFIASSPTSDSVWVLHLKR